MSKFSGNPRIPFIGAERPWYAGRTLVRSAYAYVMRDRSLDCLGFGWDGLLGTRVGWDGLLGRRVGWDGGPDGSAGRTGRMARIGRRGRSEAKPLGYAGRTGVRSAYPDEDADSSSDKVRNFDLNKYIIYLINFKNSYLLHTNSVFDGLYIHA